MPALLAGMTTGGVAHKAAVLNRDANRAYKDKQYDKAASMYDEALTRAPESGSISYNLGNTLYREQKFGDAAAQLRRAAEGGDPAVRGRSYYNLGNSFYKMGKLPEALDSYRRALDLDPGDRDAKINFEKTLLQMQQQQQQQKQQGKGQNDKNQKDKSGQGNDQKDEKSQDQQSKSGEQKKDGSQQQQQAQNQQKQQDQQAGADSLQQKEQPAALGDTTALAAGDLRPEEAMRILQAMREQEKELQKQRARQVRARARRVEKDW
jgi:Ca-activated chloride channel family protein